MKISEFENQSQRFLRVAGMVLGTLLWTGVAAASVTSEVLGALSSAPTTGAPVKDFRIACRLASRVDLDGLSYAKTVAVLGSDTRIDMESMISNGGAIVLSGYIAEATKNPTVRSGFGQLTTLSDSVFLSNTSIDGTGILGLVKAGQVITVLESIPGVTGQEPAFFHRIELKGKLSSPVFSDCMPLH